MMLLRRISTLFAAASIAFLGWGCSVHKSLLDKEPPLEMPASYTVETETGAPPAGKWWRHLGDERLDSLIEEAFRDNLDLRQARARFIQSMAVFESASSSKALQLYIEGTAGKTRGGTAGTDPSDTYRLSAAAAYELDLWRKLSARESAAHMEALASKNDTMALYMSLSASVAELYYLAVEQRLQLELSGKTINSFRDTLEGVHRRYEAGLVSVLDVHQSRQSLAVAEAQRPVFEARLKKTLNALSVIAGRFPGEQEADGLARLPDIPAFPTGMPSGLIMRRPDIQSALLRLKASDERLAASIAERFPSFNLVGSYGGASQSLKSVLDSPNIMWNLLLNIAQPVIDGGRRKAEVKRSEAVFMERLAGYHKTLLEAFREVEDALAQNREAEQRIAILGGRVISAEAELRLSLDNYMQGLSDYLPVLTAQRRYYEAESLLLEARRALVSARVALARSLGGDWMEPEMQSETQFKMQSRAKDTALVEKGGELN